MLLAVSCSRERRPDPVAGFWDTGSFQLDSLLNRADTLDHVFDYDADLTCGVYRDIASLAANGGGDARMQAVAAYAGASLLEFLDDYSEAEVRRGDSLALARARTSGDEYLTRRMELRMAIGDTDVTSRTAALYSLLPYFSELRDSIRVTDILYELTNSYGDIWDPAREIDCFREIIRWTPEFVAPLRDLMSYNILAVERGTAPSERYLHILDSVASERALLDDSAPLALMVYSDRYRLRGNPADLDTAGIYASRLTIYHDALKTYWAQKLRCALSEGNRAEADTFATLIQSHAADSTPMEVETLPPLREYYLAAGDSAAARRVADLRASLVRQAEAHESSNALADMRATRRIREITAGAERSSHISAGLLAAAAVALIAVVVALFMLLRRHRREKRKSDALETQLINARRRLSVAHLKNSTPEAAESSSWNSFEAVFLEMHPGFADALRRDFPQLTRNDIQLCALIRMDMDTKHIASLLSIQPESVKKRYHRLRLKLGLDSATPLVTFLSSY